VRILETRCDMTKQVRKNYTAEFKREAVRLVTDEGYKIAEAARSLDINANMLGRLRDLLVDR
jgi:transposase